MVKEKNGELLRADSELTQKLAENQDAIDKLEQRENMSNGSSDGADEPQVIIARVYAPKAVKTQAVVRYMTPDASGHRSMIFTPVLSTNRYGWSTKPVFDSTLAWRGKTSIWSSRPMNLIPT